MVHQKDKPTKERTPMDAIFDKFLKAIKEVGLPSVMCIALCYFIWHQNGEREVKDSRDQQNTQILLVTVSKNTDVFVNLSSKIDKLAESVALLSQKKR